MTTTIEVTPGAPTEMAVEARLFARKDIKKLGIAPLTSMFHHGENTTRFVDDFRPEVHDSDGLLVAAANGEWIWRPLTNRIPGLARPGENRKRPGTLKIHLCIHWY